jgi:uracil-DNA glycosylase
MSLRSEIVKPKTPLVSNSIVFVGQAPGQTEVEKGEPFVGFSGQELTTMMHLAGIMREDSYLTNVFDFKFPGNQLEWICTKDKKSLPKDYPVPAIKSGLFVLPEYLDSLDRLRDELERWKPNLVVALGNEALWALCRTTNISAFRGTVMMSTLVPGLKVIPTYHPAYVLRNWDVRLFVIADLIKARAESETKTFVRPARQIWIDPTIQDLWDFHKHYIEPMDRTDPLSVDIETSRSYGRHITSIAFAPTPDLAICVPFVDYRQEDYSYWRTQEEELAAWKFCQHLMEGPQALLFQNGLYDIQWMWTIWKIRSMYALHDTNIGHHAMFPEMPKKLDFMASLYTREVAWKKLRPGKKEDKRDA